MGLSVLSFCAFWLPNDGTPLVPDIRYTLSVCQDPEADTDDTWAEGARQLRSRSLRLVAEALRRFPDTVDYGFLWPRLFAAVEPLIARIPTEVRLLHLHICRGVVISLTAFVAMLPEY